MARDGAEQVLFEREGVFIHTTIVAQQNEDALVPGKIVLSRRPEGLFIEWTPMEEPDNESNQGDTEWTVVDTVGYKNDRGKAESESVTMKSRVSSPPTHHKYMINFDISDLKSFRRSSPRLGWSYLIFILKCGTTYPALHFHQGGTKAFIKQLETHLVIKKSPKDSCLFLVREHDPQALSKSFDELKLFDEEQADDMLTKFIKDPYTATWGGFSKVTNFLRDTLLVPEPEVRPQEDVAEILLECVPGMAINNQEEPGFEMITTQELPPRPEVKRSTPLTPQHWSQHMDNQGQVKDVESLKEAIFRGGVDPSIRIEVWKFLLKYYSWDSTYQSRTEQRKKKVDDYFRMKLQWKSVTEEQERRNSFIRDRKSLIEKDVTRTDRTHHFFHGEDNPNISVLYDILMTYCMYNFDLGYVQGMSDLLAPILVVMENEVDAFWCFAGFMELLYHNFDIDQAGMKTQLVQLHTLVRFTDPKLCNYLESHDSGNMYFCFRWLLIIFKREFSFPDIMRLWEVLWTGKPCDNFHLLICLALLDTEKITLIENNFGFTEILKHINDLSGQIELSETINKAEGIYLQLSTCKHLPAAVADIIGIEQPSAPSGGDGIDGASSTRSSPDHTSLQISTNGTEGNTGEKSLAVQLSCGGSNDTTDTRTTTPDDSSIEILPIDHMDLVL